MSKYIGKRKNYSLKERIEQIKALTKDRPLTREQLSQKMNLKYQSIHQIVQNAIKEKAVELVAGHFNHQPSMFVVVVGQGSNRKTNHGLKYTTQKNKFVRFIPEIEINPFLTKAFGINLNGKVPSGNRIVHESMPTIKPKQFKNHIGNGSYGVI